MKPNILIVVEGGHIQEVLSDTPDTTVTIKTFADARRPPPDLAEMIQWPAKVVTPAELRSMFRPADARAART